MTDVKKEVPTTEEIFRETMTEFAQLALQQIVNTPFNPGSLLPTAMNTLQVNALTNILLRLGVIYADHVYNECTELAKAQIEKMKQPQILIAKKA